LYSENNGQGDRFVLRACGPYDFGSGWVDVINSVKAQRAFLTLWWNTQPQGNFSAGTRGNLRIPNHSTWIDVQC
jgi:hypothetical protein